MSLEESNLLSANEENAQNENLTQEVVDIVNIPLPSVSHDNPLPVHDHDHTATNDVNLVTSDSSSVQQIPEASKALNNDSSQSPNRKRIRIEEENEDDGRLCPICLDNWTNAGSHRICALRCGHLFGLNCIERWFVSQAKKSCPTCKKKSSNHDIRFIYAKKLIALDVAELEVAKKQLCDVVEEKNRLQIQLTKSLCKERVLIQENSDLNQQLKQLTYKIEEYSTQQPTKLVNSYGSEPVRMFKEKSIEICKEGGCRVMDSNSHLHTVAVSMKSPNAICMFGFGVRILNLDNYKPTSFMPLHTKPIRDLHFHPRSDLLLSVSLDKSVKVFDNSCHLNVSSCMTESPLWSCCWDVNNLNIFYIGEQKGSIQKFDLRKMPQPVCNITIPGDTSPIVNISSVGVSSKDDLPYGGLIACKLNSTWIFENTETEYLQHLLPIEGAFTSMSYQNDTQHLLISSRPNSRFTNCRHLVYTIQNKQCNPLHCFEGGLLQNVLSRSCFVSHKSDFVAAHDQISNSVILWSINDGQKVYQIPAQYSVLDINGMKTNNTNFLMTLSEKKLDFFKFQ